MSTPSIAKCSRAKRFAASFELATTLPGEKEYLLPTQGVSRAYL